MIVSMRETILLALSAGFSGLLGVLVFLRNPGRRTHRHFAVLAVNLMLWALGVLCIINTHAPVAARFWLQATFMVAAFLPASFYHFTGYFPHQRFEGFRSVLALLYVGAVVQVVGTLTPYYLLDVKCDPHFPPTVVYGPVFNTYAVWVVVSMLFSFTNLLAKWRSARGFERRQIEHVLLGIFLSTTLASTTNVLAPVLEIRNLEAYGPIFMVLMMAIFAYAMVRFHLLDIWVIVSRATVYGAVTVFVVFTFLGAVSLVHWVFSAGGQTRSILTTVPAALVIALVLQPMKERMQLLVDRTILMRRYDVNRLCARLTHCAAQYVRLDELLGNVADEIRTAMGVSRVRVLLVDEKDPDALVTEYTSAAGESRLATREHAVLLNYVRVNPEPIILKKLQHERPNAEREVMAEHLAALGASLCVPLRASSGVVGLLNLAEKTSGEIYSSDDLVVASTIAGPLGTAIENARLYRKLEEISLHASRILSNMRGGVVAVDPEGKVTTINEGAKAILGRVRVGQPLDALGIEVAQSLEQTLEEERGIGDFETVITGPNGEEIPVVLSTSCLKTPGGVNTGAMIMIHDLTQVKRLEQNVQRADRLSSIGTLAAGMAHEVKNPLVSIKTFAQLLMTRYDDDDFRKTFAEVVPDEVERIDTIVSRLLDFARAKPVEFQRQDIRRTINDVIALVENQTRKANIVTEKDFPDDALWVHGDEQQLHQVFLNLVLNAVDAVKEKGERDGAAKVPGARREPERITIRAFRDRAHLPRKGLAPLLEAECVRIVMSDSGSGIAVEHMERLFTPFFTTKEDGCGLGLSVVHGIVGEHGGDIDVISVPGEGTTFTVTLPLVRDVPQLAGKPQYECPAGYR